MMNHRLLRWSVIVSVGLSLPLATSLCAADDPPKPSIRDVALGEGGTLEGVVIDAQGVPVVATDVKLFQGDQMVETVKTDALGVSSRSRLMTGSVV